MEHYGAVQGRSTQVPEIVAWNHGSRLAPDHPLNEWKVPLRIQVLMPFYSPSSATMLAPLANSSIAPAGMETSIQMPLNPDFFLRVKSLFVVPIRWWRGKCLLYSNNAFLVVSLNSWVLVGMIAVAAYGEGQ